jgi:polar amino acid transport system substrate-binding protein
MHAVRRITQDLRSARRSRWIFVAAVCVVAWSGAATSPASAASLDEIKKRGYLVTATEDNYPPFEFIQDGQPAGLDSDLYKALKDWAGFPVRQEILPWQGLLAGVVSGQFDVALTAATISDQRAQQLSFSMPIAEATHYYMKRKGDTRIQSIKDLSGLTVGMQQGSSIHQRLPEIEALLQKTGGKLGKVSLYASFPEAYQDLANGRIDYVLNSVVAIADVIRKRPNDFELGQAVVPIGYHAWAVKRGNKDLLDYLNKFFTEQRKNGSLYRLQEKWLGRSFPDLPWEAKLPGNRPMPE